MVSPSGPNQTVIVTCRSKVKVLGRESEKDNAITIDWHMPVSFEPRLYAIAVGNSRFSKNMIHSSSVFAVNFLAFSMKDAAIACGSRSGEHTSKLKDAGIRTKDARSIDCPVLEDAAGVIECEVIQEIEAGDHTIFIGKAVYYEEKAKEKRLFHAEGNEFTTTLK